MFAFEFTCSIDIVILPAAAGKISPTFSELANSDTELVCPGNISHLLTAVTLENACPLEGCLGCRYLSNWGLPSLLHSL